jgi:hypothetical protein
MPSRFNFGFKPRPCMTISRAQEILREQGVIDPVPSRQTFVNKILDGTLEGIKTDSSYLIYKDSFVLWVRSFQPQSQTQANKRPKLRLAASL